LNVVTGGGVIRLERVQIEDDSVIRADTVTYVQGIETGVRLGRHHAPKNWLYTEIRDSDWGRCYETNLSTDEEGELRAVAFGGKIDLKFRAILDSQEIIVERLKTYDGSAEASVRYSSDTTGTKDLCVDVFRDGESIDSRYLELLIIN
jgi:hypothetical protein